MKLANAAISLAVAAALAAPLPAAAQEPVASFSQLSAGLKPGNRIRLTDARGRHVEGRLESLTPETITLKGDGPLAFEAAEVRLIRRREPGGRYVTGMAVGAIAGLGAGIAACATYPKDDPLRGDACYAAIGLLWIPGLGAGALVGAMFPGKLQEVYRAPGTAGQARVSIAPVITPRAKGLAVGVSF